MYVRRVLLRNFGPYRGQQSVELEPTIYAIVARHDGDSERSNWVGKTWFLSAIRFAVTGQKPEECDTEDDWITWGEPDGEVELELSDGTRIKRSRKRGRGTQTSFTPPGALPSRQAQAQEAITRHLGLSVEDFGATSFVAQKKTARLVVSDPAERTKMVNTWFDLGDVQGAEERLRSAYNERVTRRRSLVPSESPLTPPDAADEQSVAEELKALRIEREAPKAALERHSEWRRHAVQAERFDSLRAEGKETRSKLDALDPPDHEAAGRVLSEATEVRVEAEDHYRRLAEVALDESWDGDCPLICQACPMANHVRQTAQTMETEVNAARDVREEAIQNEAEAQAAHAKALAEVTHRATLEARLESLRAQAGALVESSDYIDEHGAPPESTELMRRLEGLDSQIHALIQRQTELRVDRQAYEEMVRKDAERQVERDRLDAEITTLREALAVVGRNGAQREIAERELRIIESSANTLLSDAGVDLTVAVEWAREGKGMAKNCEQCGWPFPASKRVKECGNCGAERGPHLIEKLEIKPSSRSGAADDIAGLAFQLAASTWLRSRRGTQWSVVCVDEAFAACDKANTRAVTTHLHRMLTGTYGFEQGFVVSHDAESMDAMPEKLVIRGTENGALL